MSRVLIVMFGIDLIHGLFPFNDYNVSLKFNDVKVNITYLGDRDIRSAESSKHSVTGLFLHRENEYLIEPESKSCLSDFGGNIKYRVLRLDQPQHTFLDPIQPSMNLERWRHNTRKRLRHRRQINDYKIEMFFIIDYAVYKYWYTQSRAADMRQRDAEAKNNIRQFYTFVINGMDVRYKNIQTSAFKISILFSGIYIADTPSKSQFIEKLKANSASGYQVDSNAALKAVTSWVKGTPGLPNYDHAMMFTRYDFTSTGSSDTTGLAWLGTLCTDQAVSVVEDHFNFNVITVAAHELGHGLSAKHDGSGNSCNSDDAFVMAPSTIPVDNQNPWKFSACSTYYFTNYINKLNRDNNNCMTVLSQDFDPDALKQYTALPGEIYDADAQCRHIVGPNSGFCKSIYRQNFMSVCTKLWCTRGDGSNGCVSAVAGDGIQCGNKKWCISGVCKYDECAPPGDESCLYGDREGVAITYNGVDVTCSFEDIKKNPAVCYSVNTTCCRQCRNFYTGIIGCEYGDRATGCSKSHCPGNPSLCCGTCYNGTLSTPSYQPTTQKNLNLCKMKATTPSTTSNIEGYRNYLIYGGAVAVNLVLLIVICICGLYHKRKQKHKSVPNSKLSGFTNRAMEYM